MEDKSKNCFVLDEEPVVKPAAAELVFKLQGTGAETDVTAGDIDDIKEPDAEVSDESEEIMATEEAADENEQKETHTHHDGKRRKKKALRIAARTAAIVVGMLVAAVYVLATVCSSVANGPSTTARDMAVLSALNSSAAKWVPGLFLPDDVIEEIKRKSEKTVADAVPLDEYDKKTESEEQAYTDKWASAHDGIVFEIVKGATYQAYVMLVRDPARVFTGTSSEDYTAAERGITVFDAAEKYGATAVINGGEFLDAGGMGTGATPKGLTYSQGKCVWDDGAWRSFVGFTHDNVLVAGEGMTRQKADALGVRDGVSFMTGSTLIEPSGDSVIRYYADKNIGAAQRTAIGQASDGTVILIVTDGRSAGSLGATHNDMINLMVSYGAVCAGMLDGGSSTVMYYPDYYAYTGTDITTLDTYRQKGLVNKYVAFTSPRSMPTFFAVAAEVK